MAPGPGGTLFVSIPARGGSVLALLDHSGRPRPGWPVALTDSDCAVPSPAVEGSVRVMCSGGDAQGQRAYAFGPDGRLLSGWPLDLGDATGRADHRVIGDDLAVVAYDVTRELDPELGLPFIDSWLVTVAADGTISTGVRVREGFGVDWRLGPDRVAYGVVRPPNPFARPEVSRITALDLGGVLPAWPLAIDGVASAPAFSPGGSILMTVGSYDSFEGSTSRTIAFDRRAQRIDVGSRELTVATALSHSEGAIVPEPPVVADDGTTFVFGDVFGGTTVFALDASGQVMDGWPYQEAAGLMHPGYCPPGDGLGCPFPPARPAVGPGDVLYLLPYVDAMVGGRIVAIGSDGRLRPGWPIELRRPGAEFWSVVVGSDGTAYALAIEPETSGSTSSATILAIDQLGTVLYRTTIIDP